jgi:hypothetical protein
MKRSHRLVALGAAAAACAATAVFALRCDRRTEDLRDPAREAASATELGRELARAAREAPRELAPPIAADAFRTLAAHTPPIATPGPPATTPVRVVRGPEPRLRTAPPGLEGEAAALGERAADRAAGPVPDRVRFAASARDFANAP